MLVVSEALDILALLTEGVYRPGGRAVLNNPSSVWAAQFTQGEGAAGANACDHERFRQWVHDGLTLGESVAKCNCVVLTQTGVQRERLSSDLRLSDWRGEFCDPVSSLRSEFLMARCIS